MIAVALVALFAGLGSIARLSVILGLGGFIAVVVLINPTFKSDLDPSPEISSTAVSDPTLAANPTIPHPEAEMQTLSDVSIVVEPSASEAFQRLRSMVGMVTGRVAGGRQTH